MYIFHYSTLHNMYYFFFSIFLELGCLSVNGIFTEIRKIYDRAYQVGLMEATQISRGTIISVFSNTKKK